MLIKPVLYRFDYLADLSITGEEPQDHLFARRYTVKPDPNTAKLKAGNQTLFDITARTEKPYKYKQRINEHSWGFARECDEFAKYACITLQMASKLTIL